MSWNSMKIDPPVAGVYELMKKSNKPTYAYWTGVYWGMTNIIASNISTSSIQAKSTSCYNGDIVSWRDMNAVSSATVVGGNQAPVVPATLAWAPMGAKPPETGIYEMRYGNGFEYSFWNGAYWGVCEPHISGVGRNMYQPRSSSCYDGTIIGWRKIATETYLPYHAPVIGAAISPPPIPTQPIPPILGTLGAVSGQLRLPTPIAPPGFFPMDQLPFISGVYLISHLHMPGGLAYCYWNDSRQFWSYCESTERSASLHPHEKGLDCYDPNQVNGWKYIVAMDATGITNKKSKKPKEFTPDEIKPELMTKRVRDWL